MIAKRSLWTMALLASLVIAAVAAGCGAATPEVIEKEVVVEKPVVQTVVVEKEKVVEKPVVETVVVEVEKEVAVKETVLVEKEVTVKETVVVVATPLPGGIEIDPDGVLVVALADDTVNMDPRIGMGSIRSNYIRQTYESLVGVNRKGRTRSRPGSLLESH